MGVESGGVMPISRRLQAGIGFDYALLVIVFRLVGHTPLHGLSQALPVPGVTVGGASSDFTSW